MDIDRFQAFLDAVEPERGATVLSAEPIPGGYSRDTVRARVQWADGTHESFVLRGDPPEDMSVFRSDRDREWELLQAIKDIDDFRIPRPRWYDATGEYLGCKCIVSEAIDSTSMQKYLDGGPDFDQSREDFVSIIAAAHATPLDKIDASIERPVSWRAHIESVLAIFDRILENQGEPDPIIAYTVKHIPKWNPTNICSYHLQEAGATPTQELAYALSTAIAILDAVRDSGQIGADGFEQVVGRISFFVNAGIRFIEETCKMRAFGEMWDQMTQERYGAQSEDMRRFRYGVQVNSLGLTEAQPENNVQRIVLEMLGVALSKKARARAIQLPAWNEALGLPRPWDQQWALRMQQVLAFETDLLEYGDIFDGSPVIAAKVKALVDGATAEMARVQEQGGMVPAIESGYVKRQLVTSHTERMRAIERGDLKIVGLNCYRETEESPLTGGVDSGIMKVDPRAEREQIERLNAFRAQRNATEVKAALANLAETARSGANIMPASILCAHSGVTTGEWSQTLRDIFGEYRAPTGIDIPANDDSRGARAVAIRTEVTKTGEELGRPLRLLIGKPGLDGHSNGAEQIAVKGRDVGFEIVYEGIRLTPEQIAKAALEEGVHLIGLSVLSGSHVEMVEDVFNYLEQAGLKGLPVVIGGIIPESDAVLLKERGIAAVYTPKDIDMNGIMVDILNLIRKNHDLPPVAAV